MSADPTSPPERLDLGSMAIADDRIAKLREDFPEVFRDGRIDFDALRRSLGDWIEPENERFGLQWPGKAAAMQAIQQPSVATLRPDPESSVEWDTTGNVIIEGDNLEVLKLLQKSYYGKVKMIYIDPPYNTGNDFIYPDNYREGLQSYLEYTGQVNGEGKRLTTNTETTGRYHSNWLNMMYPRLYLARNLLREDGVIFVSIDDTEVSNLRALMNEVFGEENLISNAVWQKKQSPQRDATFVSDTHDHILLFGRNLSNNEDAPHHVIRRLSRTSSQIARYTNPDSDERGPWVSADCTINKTIQDRPNLYYAINNPHTGEEVWPTKQRVWTFERPRMVQLIEENRIWWGSTGRNFPRVKSFLNEIQEGVVPTSIWLRDSVGDNQESAREIRNLFPDQQGVFDTPKPTRLVNHMLQLTTKSTVPEVDIVLDFFAGSGTTGHAVMKQNAKDGGNRRYIMVQLPEPIDPPKTLDDGTELRTIADITRERVRRAGRKIASELGTRNSELGTRNSEQSTPQPDLGFRSYRLDTSNFRPWDGDLAGPAKQATMGFVEERAAQIAMRLQDATDNLIAGRTSDDILVEIVLKLGYELTVPVERLTLAGKEVFAVAGGDVLICLNPSLTLEVIEAMVDRRPGQIVCLDAGFNDNDELKVNATQIIRTRAHSEDSTIAFKVV